MKIYLAAPYSARELMAQYAAELEQIGLISTARWVNGSHEINDGSTGPATAYPDSDVRAWAREDLDDIDRSNVLVVFTSEAVGGGGLSGGRHVETGYALARGIPVLVVGDPENIFQRTVTSVLSWHEALIVLAGQAIRREREALKAVAG